MYSLQYICRALLMLTAVSSCTALSLPNLFLNKNFHVVIPGVLYRSAQLKPRILEEKVKTLGIKTIINLRGENPWMQWWWSERRIAAQYDIDLVNIALSATRFPNKEQIRTLITTIRTGRTPILIHCAHGSDRTGAGCALFVRELLPLLSPHGAYTALAEQAARRQLSCKRFGHWKWFFPVMDKFIDAWLALRRNHESPEQALEHYNPHEYGYEISLFDDLEDYTMAWIDGNFVFIPTTMNFPCQIRMS